MDLGIVCLYRGICGDTVLESHNGSDIHPERHISAGIVLPSTSASFVWTSASFLKK